jgi:hypothetical protein
MSCSDSEATERHNLELRRSSQLALMLDRERRISPSDNPSLTEWVLLVGQPRL